MNRQETILTSDRLDKHYGDFHAVKGIALSVRRGEIFGLLGPNGAGKTTVIRMLVGLIRSTGGEVSYFGRFGLKDMQQVLPRIGCIIEEPRFYPYLSGRRNLMLASLYYPKGRVKGRIDQVLDLVGLQTRADDPVKNYSQGMRQRLGIAAAMLHDPELIILDEPTNGLDPQGIIELRRLIIRLKEEMGKTIILSSHILSEVEQMADSMAIIHQGRCVAQGSVAELLNAGSLQVTIGTDDASRASQLLQAKGFEVLTAQGSTVILNADKETLPQIAPALLDGGLTLHRLEHRRKLEDYFLKLTTA